MPTNADAKTDLEAAKTALENQTGAASGPTLDDLLRSIQKIADEVGQLEELALEDAYVPQTTAFQEVTADATAFVGTLNRLKTTFAAVASFAAVLDRVISYVK